MIQPNEIKAARALIKLKQSELAELAGISLQTLKNIERGASDPRVSTLDLIKNTLESEGVEFLGDKEIGVKLKSREE